MDWAHDYFERGYAQRWSLGPPSAETKRETDVLWTHLRLSPGATLLDVGCGHGRHAVAFAQRGADVIGVDFAWHLLVRASQLTRAFAAASRWVRADMRWLPIRTGAIQATTLFDAFGFFEQEDENQVVLRELARVLVPRGRLALKVANGEPILAHFRATEREVRGETTVDIQRILLTDPPRLVEDLAVNGPRGSGRYQRRQRIYRMAEVTASIEAVGLATVAVAANVMGAPFEPATSPAIVVIAERPPA
jgi:SAM-dependent methyltransferase